MLHKIRVMKNTLNSIEVRGKDNLDKLLGCILVLEQIEDSLATKPTEVDTEVDTEVSNDG